MLGRWFEGMSYEGIYFIPAILGAFGVLVLAIDVLSSFGSVCQGKQAETS